MSEQPAPKPGRQNVTPIAQSAFLALLKQREKQDIATYGTSLQTENGRDAIQDALEECVDLWQYLVQIRLEHAERVARIVTLQDRIAALDAEIARLKGGQP